MSRPMVGRPRAFTLVELLVVIGLIALLVAILLPAISSAQRSARAVQCASNMRQVVLALMCYANEWRGKYPPNVAIASPGSYWYSDDCIGQYLASDPSPPGSLRGAAGAVFACPEDPEGVRSYAMNIWASSKVDPNVLAASPPRGKRWDPGSSDDSRLILLAERWSSLEAITGGYLATAYVGYAGLRPAQRFGGQGGIVPGLVMGRWGRVNCELPYVRHRRPGDGKGKEAKGCVNLAYGDGHVALKAHSDLVNQQTGLSTLESMWSPLDPQLNQ